MPESVLAPIFKGMASDFVTDVYGFVWEHIGLILCSMIGSAIALACLKHFLISLFEGSGCEKREARKKAGFVCNVIDLADNLKGWVK